MKNKLTEKHGYLDLKSLYLDELTDEIYTLIKSDNIEFNDSYIFKKNDKKYICRGKAAEGLLFYDFEVDDFPNKKLKKLIVVIVKITDPAKVNHYRFNELKDNTTFGFYISGGPTCNEGYIYISYNAHKAISNDDRMKRELRNTIYHELRHYFDDMVNIIPRRSKGTIASNPSYIIELATEVLNIEVDENTQVLKDKTNDILLKRLLYITNPTEIQAFYHSFVVDIQAYVKKHPDITYNELLEYIKKISNDDNTAFLYIMSKLCFKDFETYQKGMKKLLTDIKAYVYYFYDTFTQIKTTDEWINKSNKFILKTYLHGKSVYMDDISKDEAINAIKQFIDNYYMKIVYKQINPYLIKLNKNIDKFIADVTN